MRASKRRHSNIPGLLAISTRGSPSPSDVDSSSSESETEEDQVDEFGLPIPLSNTDMASISDETPPGLILMENWDGKLVLYQTKPQGK